MLSTILSKSSSSSLPPSLRLLSLRLLSTSSAPSAVPHTLSSLQLHLSTQQRSTRLSYLQALRTLPKPHFQSLTELLRLAPQPSPISRTDLQRSLKSPKTAGFIDFTSKTKSPVTRTFADLVLSKASAADPVKAAVLYLINSPPGMELNEEVEYEAGEHKFRKKSGEWRRVDWVCKPVDWFAFRVVVLPVVSPLWCD